MNLGASPIRVLIADDQEMVRRGLRLMVEAEPDQTVVGEATDGAAAIEQAAVLRPDVVLMDVRMPHRDGIDATRAIIDAGTAGAVVLVTTFDDEISLREGIRAGAAGFLLKDAGPDLLALAIRAAFAGDTLIEPSMTRALIERGLGPWDAARAEERTAAAPALIAALARLSSREREVLSEVARGASNAEIAKRLWLSETTVKSHLSSVLLKTGATSRVQAAVFAYESGFVRPGWAAARMIAPGGHRAARPSSSSVLGR